MDVILRPVYNRPEMLYLSIEYELKAREYFKLNNDDFITIFLVEHGADPIVLDIVNNYPMKKDVIKRDEKFGLSKNILLGMKDAFKIAHNFIIYIEDDVLVHHTYFKYLNIILNMFDESEYSLISPFNHNDNGDVHYIYKGHHYTALAPLINKKFFNLYIKPCITETYYKDFVSRNNFVLALNQKYRKWWGKEYKYRDGAHNEQAGLINRLVDVALIEENRYVIMPEVNRQIHIGYYGKNRPGGKLPGSSFNERLNNLREIIKSADKMYELSAAKQYRDYKTFSKKLDEWNGELFLRGIYI